MGKGNPAPYKLGEIYIGPKEWHVTYYYYSLSKQKYIRDKARLGTRGLSNEQKQIELTRLRDKLNALLVDRNKKGLYHEDLIGKNSNFDYQSNIPQALNFIRDSNDEDISEDRKNGIRETAGILLKFFEENKVFSTLKITALDDQFLKLFIKWCKSNEKSGKTINKYLSILQFATEWLHRKKYIDQSFSTVPLRVAQPKNETGRFPPLTHEEKQAAFSYFKNKDKGYHLYIFWLYYTCIRGAELYRIKRKDIDFEKRTVFIKWFDSKNGLSNYVQILEPLYNLLIELGIDKLPNEMYLFGEKFTPSTKKYVGPQSSIKWWYHREAMGMPKEKQVYGLKHTFNVDYVENNKYNIDWEWLRRHNRHATVQQTQQYISTLTAYFLDETKSVILNYS